MTKIHNIFCAMLFACISSVVFSAAPAKVVSPSETINWVNYNQDIFAKSKEIKKNIFIFAMADACDWCHEMTTTTFKNSAIITLINSQFYPVILHADIDGATAEKYQLMSVPTFIIMNSEGSILFQDGGFKNVEEMTAMLQKQPDSGEKK